MLRLNRFFGRLVAVAVVLAVIGCSSNEKEMAIDVQDGLSPAHFKKAESGLEILFNTCPGLRRYLVDLSQGRPVTVGEPLYLDREERGWKDAVYVEFVVADRPKAVPAAFRAGGHRCHFSVSPDAPAGVSVAKTECVSLCAGEPKSSEQGFFPAVQ